MGVPEGEEDRRDPYGFFKSLENPELTVSQHFYYLREHFITLRNVMWSGTENILEQHRCGTGVICSFLLVILIVLGVFFAEWRASEKEMLEQLTKLNQALACHDH